MECGMTTKREKPRPRTGAPMPDPAVKKGSAPGTDSLHEPTTYIYTDEEGQPLFRVVRHPGKHFRQQAWDPASQRWLPKLYGARRVPYRLPELIAGVKAGRTIYVVEGEKDADALREIWKVATCNPGGTGMGWRPEYCEHFKGANVRIIQDKDHAGHEHALKVRDFLKPVAKKVRILEVQIGNDVSDHLASGATLAFRPGRPYAKISPPKRPRTYYRDEVVEPLDDERGVQAVLSRLQGVVAVSQGQWEAFCPTHEDTERSLCIGIGDLRPVKMYCQAGCDFKEIMSALGLNTPQGWQAVM